MLLVRIELRPWGGENGKRVLGEALIANCGRDRFGHTYRAEIRENGDEDLRIAPFQRTVEICGYDRSQSSWNLVSAILQALADNQQEPFAAAPASETTSSGGPAVSNISGEDLEQVRLHTARFKQKIVGDAGGLLDATALMEAVGLPSRHDVIRAVQERRLLALLDGDDLRFPACQILDGAILPGIRSILEAAPATNGWRILQYLLHPEDGLAGRRPLDLLQGTAKDLEVAVRFARRLEE